MSNQIEIKVCGINDENSMQTAINYKVDYIGLVFYQASPRNISIEQSGLSKREWNELMTTFNLKDKLI